MSPVSRGFGGRRRPVADPSRLPPGQYLERGFPVLSAGPTPHTPLDEWTFLVGGEVEEPVSWTWDEFLALPAETPTVDHATPLGLAMVSAGRERSAGDPLRDSFRLMRA